MYETEIAAITPNLIAVTAYSQSSKSIVYLTRTSAGWGSAQTVSSASYEYLDLGFDQGDVAIAYFNSSDDLMVSYSLCGDGSQSEFEECDDGNSDETDACTSECQLNCGDGTVQTDEECDDGNASNMDECTTSCKNAVCGDGYVWYHKESCDDSNTTDGDWCGSNCKTESPPTADAGVDQNVRWKIGYSKPPQVYLSGLGTDPERETITLSWTMTSVPGGSTVTTASIINATNPRPAFQPDVAGTYNVTLTVTDADGHKTSNDVNVVVRRY
jgi:cysteine-rich repeat protein